MLTSSPMLLILTDKTENSTRWSKDLSQWADRLVIVQLRSHRLNSLDEVFSLAIVDVEAEEISQEILEVCSSLRAWMTQPILLLTKDRDESRLLCAYEMGIDACIVNPISNKLLTAKINAWLRYSNADGQGADSAKNMSKSIMDLPVYKRQQ